MISIWQRGREAQRGSLTCPRSHSQSVAQPTLLAWPRSLRPEPAVCPLQAGRPGPTRAWLARAEWSASWWRVPAVPVAAQGALRQSQAAAADRR